MERKIYTVGLLNNPKMVIENNGICYYCITEDNMEIKVILNINTNSTLVLNNHIDSKWDITKIERDVKKVVKKDGSCWEGDWCNGKPFGFGSIYNSKGNRIYKGFMFEGKKVGFGEEYYTDSHTVNYYGNFMNDKRHGWGISYDRNMRKLYEGVWRCGKNSNLYYDKVVIKDGCNEDCLEIHDLIKEMEIGEECLNEVKDDLVIENYLNLDKIVVKKKSLKNLNSLRISNCKKLKNIEIGDGGFDNVKNVIIESI